MTLADWDPVIQAIIAGIALVLTTLIGIYVPRAIAAFEKRTGVQVTDQERTAIYSALKTATGLIQTKLDTGVLKATDITPENRTVVAVVKEALDRVPDAVKAQGTTLATAAAIAVAPVDTKPVPPVIIVPGPRQ